MKKILVFVMLMFLLTGCKAQETFETIGNAYEESAVTDVWQIAVDLPGEMAMPVMETQSADKLYEGEGFTLSTHIGQGGDMNSTLLEHTGLSKDKLNVICTDCGQWKRYDAAWTTAGEGGAQTGRIAILDDGKTHFVMVAMTPAESAGEITEVWQPIFRSFRLEAYGTQVNTGS